MIHMNNHVCSYNTYTGNKDGPDGDGRYCYEYKCSCGATSWRVDA